MNKPKEKGTRNEHYIVQLHLAEGIECKRVPGSGLFGKIDPELFADIVIKGKLRGECKVRKQSQWKTIEKWLGSKDILFLREDRKKPIVVMPWRTYLELIRNAIL